MSSRDATRKAMDEVTPAVIAIAFGLSAVFVPTAFISGITGQFYRQFALTIAVSTMLSAFNSLTLSPALCALLLKPHDAPKDWFERLWDRLFGRFFAAFNRGFVRLSGRYATAVGWFVRRTGIGLCRLCRADGSDLVRLPHRADRLHPGPGPGLLHHRHPAARRRVARADRRGRAPRRARSSWTPRASASRWPSPASRAPRAPTRSNAGAIFVGPTPFEERTRSDPSAKRAAHHPAAPVVRDPGRADLRHPAAARPRPRHRRRLQAAGRGPRGARVQGAAGGHRRAGASPRTASPRCGTSSPASGPAPRSSSPTSTASRRRS